MRKKRDQKTTQPIRFNRDGQVWEVVWKAPAATYAVKVCKKGYAYGIVEKFHDVI
jgi:hypothetical protein